MIVSHSLHRTCGYLGRTDCPPMLTRCRHDIQQSNQKLNIAERDPWKRGSHRRNRLTPKETQQQVLCSPSSVSSLPPSPSPTKRLNYFVADALKILSSSVGLSDLSVSINPIRCTTRIPVLTRPKMVCFPSSQGVGPSVMKN